MKTLSTKTYIGDFYPHDHLGNRDCIDEKGHILIEEIYGNAYFEDYTGDAISLRKITGSAMFSNWAGNADRLERITGSAYFQFWKGNAPQLTEIERDAHFEYYEGRTDKLERVGSASFSNWKSNAPNLQSIAYNANFVNWGGSAPRLETIGIELHFNNANLRLNNLLAVQELKFDFPASIIESVYIIRNTKSGRDSMIHLDQLISNCLLDYPVNSLHTEALVSSCIPILKLICSNPNELKFNLDEGYSKMIRTFISKHWDHIEKISLNQIFHLKSRTLKRICFEILSPSELMKGLGAERIQVSGIELNYFQYDGSGNKTPITKYNVYETYHTTEHEKHQLNEIFAVKCWCSTTENEHWLFIEEQYANSPLSAIASTFHIPDEDMSQIRCIKRQGDILIAEMKESLDEQVLVKKIIATGESSYKLVLVDSVNTAKDISEFKEVGERSFLLGEDINSIDSEEKENTFQDTMKRMIKSTSSFMGQPLTAEEYFSLLEAES